MAAELGRRIVSQVYLPATVLPAEAELLQEFGVSRTVLRDAVKSLESKALLLAADNPYLASICAAFTAALTISLQHTNPSAASNRASLPAHEHIVQALGQRDGPAAARHSLAQLDEAMQRLRAVLTPARRRAPASTPASTLSTSP